MRRTIVLAVAFALSVAVPARAEDAPAPAAAETATGVLFEPGRPAWTDVLAKAKSAGKPVFVQFSTDWCGWCRKLEKDTFAKSEVGELMQAFVNVYVDAEKGEGVELAKRYAAKGFPTLVVVDAEGAEIDRIVGYRAPAEFTAEIRRILAGDGTLAALRRRFAETPADADVALAYGAKLAGSDPKAAVVVFEQAEEAAAKADRPTQGRVRLERAAVLLATGDRSGAMDVAEALLRDFADTPSAAAAARRVGAAFVGADARRALTFLDAVRRVAKEPEDRRAVEEHAVAVHRNGIAAALRRQADAAGDDPQALNEVAWTCFEMKLNVREAVAWARRAVEKSSRDPAILDTLANLLWISGARAEAIGLETEAASRAEGRMKSDFEGLAAKWRAESAADEAAGAVPMVPLVPPAQKPAGDAPRK